MILNCIGLAPEHYPMVSFLSSLKKPLETMLILIVSCVLDVPEKIIVHIC